MRRGELSIRTRNRCGGGVVLCVEGKSDWVFVENDVGLGVDVDTVRVQQQEAEPDDERQRCGYSGVVTS
jgi:uncharacterized protein YegJ (DUF2314 family)